MNHPNYNPAFSDQILTIEGLTVPSSGGQWVDVTDGDFWLNPWARIVLGGKASQNVKLRIVQGAWSVALEDVVYLVADTELNIVAGVAPTDLNDAATYECGFDKGKLQIQSSAECVLHAYVQGRAKS